ncbi:TPA: O-antigen ligase family protein [Stenotrophomonas maltophilia]|jgi:O-antigen ligase|uniref:O-antigen ligase family protein n=1 Tax=Stenotrophomonas maltophilia TaxID=40324 RepID=A0AAI9C7E6_STEMA|nr:MULTISPECIES: O-antigen ligase family protein [Stenotrophomonas]EKT4439462.1 O-antigen ligase family protein [Stenotrophomonas maltophilia]MBN5011309.1 O-antigen ligase family protein [Stenotrophomonas maltophilia]MCI1150374.1 O-antigen ligase family protein [Stenotrophomonas maltophilia]UID77463.1 O-antigen ligase family protein [Stenotrophomonas maltophilia]HDS1822363.1 O-antigen ligase family protein [Stenotrophomonas maltophilia]
MSNVIKAKLSDRILLYAWIPLSIGPMLWGIESVGGMQLHHVAVLIVYAYAFILSCMRGTILTVNRYLLFLLAYILVLGLALNAESLDFWLKYASYIGVIVVANHLVKAMPFEVFVGQVTVAMKAILAICVVLALIAPVVAFHVIDGQNSLNGIYAQKNTFGRLIYFLLFFVGLQAVMQSRRLTTRDMVWMALCAVSLFLSNSRTAQAMGLILAFVPFAFQWKIIRLSLVPVLASIVGLVVLGFATSQISFGEVGSNHDYIQVLGVEVPLTGRATIWQGALDGINKEGRWLFGFGLDGFYGSSYRSYVSNIGLGVFVPEDSHNGYVDLLLNLGMVGAIIFFIIGAKLYVNASRFPVSGEKIAILSFLILYLGSNLTESYFVKTSNITSFMFMVMFMYSYSYRRFQNRT